MKNILRRPDHTRRAYLPVARVAFPCAAFLLLAGCDYNNQLKDFWVSNELESLLVVESPLHEGPTEDEKFFCSFYGRCNADGSDLKTPACSLYNNCDQ